MANQTYRIFEFYNVRTSCLQLDVAINEKDGKKECMVFLTMAASINPKVSMDVVKKGGTQLFDYNNKTMMKLEKHEMAALAKLKNPYYVRKYATQATDRGQPKADASGKPINHTDVFIHADNRKNSSTTLTIGYNSYDETGCFISLYYKDAQGYKNYNVYLNTNQTYEMACAAEWGLTKIYEESGIEWTPQDSNKQASQQQQQQFSQNAPMQEPLIGNVMVDINELLR